MDSNIGTLYIVSTPIGNLKDITVRAIATLKCVDYVLCEDTRITGKLLASYSVDVKMESFNEASEERKQEQIISDLKLGRSIALVSDSGTPLVSDPGYKLVRRIIAEGVRVESIPGPSAILSALTVSGLPPDKFTFVGFLPKKEGKKTELLRRIKASKEILASTVIIYESPFRLIKTLESIRDIFGDIEIAACRELTKLHEEIKRGKTGELIDYFGNSGPRGEFVILF